MFYLSGRNRRPTDPQEQTVALYILQTLDDNGRPFDDSVLEAGYYDDKDYNGNARPAAEADYEALAAQLAGGSWGARLLRIS